MIGSDWIIVAIVLQTVSEHAGAIRSAITAMMLAIVIVMAPITVAAKAQIQIRFFGVRVHLEGVVLPTNRRRRWL